MRSAFSFYIKYGIIGSKAFGMGETRPKKNEPDKISGSLHE